MPYTYHVDFLGINTNLTPEIDWSWWENAKVALDPQERLAKHGSLSIDQLGMSPLATTLSSNVLVDVHFELWVPNKGKELEEVSGKFKFNPFAQKGSRIRAMGLKRPRNGDAQTGSYIIELMPDSQFTLICQDELADEMRRYHLKWKTFFNRCRLVETVDAPESLSPVA